MIPNELVEILASVLLGAAMGAILVTELSLIPSDVAILLWLVSGIVLIVYHRYQVVVAG